MDYLKFAFESGFWRFFGCVIILALILQVITTIWIRFLRFFVLLRHGYPPPNCDADGDFKQEDEED